MRTLLRICWTLILLNVTLTISRREKQFGLFSIVQFPNDECTSSSSTTTMGTCLASTECTNNGGSGAGSCAAGFGVCCVVSTSSCSSSVSTNITYIRNPGYPSSITPTTTGSCSFTINKVSDDICQLRLDFVTMTGYTELTTGACTDYFEATGSSGSNPPKICGTNTDFHMYVEFGGDSTDSITLKTTYGDTSTKSWNILARQIACTATWKAPTDCVQYFTGVSGNVKSYNFGTQLLQGQDYDNCIRQEKGYCRIAWQQSSITTPDPFQLDTANNAVSDNALGGTSAFVAPATAAIGYPCPLAFIRIPNASQDGITPLNPVVSHNGFQNLFCGSDLGLTVTPPSVPSVTAAMTSGTTPFTLGVWTLSATLAPGPAASGFNLDYTQLPC